MIHVQTGQFETWWNSNMIKIELDPGTTESIYYSKLATLHMVWHLKLEVIENYCNSNREWKVIFCVWLYIFIDTPFWFHKYFNVLVDQLSQFYSSKRHFVEILFFSLIKWSFLSQVNIISNASKNKITATIFLENERKGVVLTKKIKIRQRFKIKFFMWD